MARLASSRVSLWTALALTAAVGLPAGVMAGSAWGQPENRRPGTTQPEKKTPRKAPELPEDEIGEKGDIGVKGKIDLRPKFVKGDRIRFKMEMDSTSKLSMPALQDAPTQQKTSHELGLVFFVKDVTEDGAVVELSFSGVKVVQETGTGKDKEKTEFDSTKSSKSKGKGKGKNQDEENPLAASCQELAGTTFTLHIDKDGNVTSVGGGANLASLGALGDPAGAGGAGGGIPGLGGGSAGGGGGSAGGGGGAGSSQGFADAIGAIFSVKKGSPFVSVGEKWSTTDDLDSGLLGGFRMITDSTVKSYVGSQAKVKVVGRIEPKSGSEGASMFKLKDSVYIGDYAWDTRAGMLSSMDMDHKIVVDSGSSGGMSMDASSKVHVTRLR